MAIEAANAIGDYSQSIVQSKDLLKKLNSNPDSDTENILINYVTLSRNYAALSQLNDEINVHQQAIECAERIKLQNSKSAKWIANDALRELRNEKIVERVKNKSKV